MKAIIRYLNKAIDIFLYISCTVIFLVVTHYIIRIFISDQFVIPSDSMTPTLQVGDRVWVNKLIAGARIYDNIDSIKNSTLQSWRTRGIRKVNRNDILIFNYPINKKKIAFKINYVYAKRCVAVPGDSISAVDGYYKNSNHKGTLGNKEAQDEFNRISEEMLPEKGKYTIPKSYDKFPWTIKNFGPIYVPRKGDVIHLNADNILLYSTIIEFETGKRISISTEGEVLADDTPLEYHIFTHNYYFTCGDHVMNSRDSRYWGFVPEEYIVGVVDFIPYSIDKNTDELRWDRILKKVF